MTSRAFAQQRPFRQFLKKPTFNNTGRFKTQGNEPICENNQGSFQFHRANKKQYCIWKKNTECYAFPSNHIKKMLNTLGEQPKHPYLSHPKTQMSPIKRKEIFQAIQNRIVLLPYPTQKKVSEKKRKALNEEFENKMKQIRLRKMAAKIEHPKTQRKALETYGISIGKERGDNQDTIIFVDNIFIVCDGHGSKGKEVSQFVATNLFKFVQQIEQATVEGLQNAIKRTQMQLDLSGFDTSFSGCTMVMVVIRDGMLYCASIGDSKAMLQIEHVSNFISACHKPQLPTEKARIQASGGVIHPTEVAKEKFEGPHRIWAPGKNSWGPGLSLSRAYGDKAARKYGVICQPEISSIKLGGNERFVVLGSDGLFDQLSEWDVGIMVQKCCLDSSIQRASISKLLAQRAQKLWKGAADDISCILIFF